MEKREEEVEPEPETETRKGGKVRKSEREKRPSTALEEAESQGMNGWDGIWRGDVYDVGNLLLHIYSQRRLFFFSRVALNESWIQSDCFV